MTRKFQGEEAESNLVMFPASKNFKVDLEDRGLGHDPLHDLLHEYSHVLDKDIPSHLDDRFESDYFEGGPSIDEESFDSLEAFMNRHKRGEVDRPDLSLDKRILERIEAIKEAKERIRYYLEEIDNFLPAKRK